MTLVSASWKASSEANNTVVSIYRPSSVDSNNFVLENGAESAADALGRIEYNPVAAAAGDYEVSVPSNSNRGAVLGLSGSVPDKARIVGWRVWAYVVVTNGGTPDVSVVASVDEAEIIDSEVLFRTSSDPSFVSGWVSTGVFPASVAPTTLTISGLTAPGDALAIRCAYIELIYSAGSNDSLTKRLPARIRRPGVRITP